MATGTVAKRDVVEFAPNVPQQIPGLKWPDGKIISNQYGERMMYTLTDGRVMFLDLDVGAKINLIELQPREAFWIRKTSSGRKGDLVQWDVWKSGERYEPAPNQSDDCPPDWPPEPPSEIEIQLRDSIHQIQARKMQTPAPAPIGASTGAGLAVPAPVPAAPHTITSSAQPTASGNGNSTTRPRTKLEDALKTVVQACHAAQLYAAEIGFQMPPWTSEDLRTMANTILIGARQ